MKMLVGLEKFDAACFADGSKLIQYYNDTLCKILARFNYFCIVFSRHLVVFINKHSQTKIDITKINVCTTSSRLICSRILERFLWQRFRKKPFQISFHRKSQKS